MAEKIITIKLDDRLIKLTVDDGGDFDTEDMLRIDYTNIMGELLTFPVIFNRVGILKAQAENALRSKVFEVDIYRARLSEDKRRIMAKLVVMTGGVKKIKPPVKDEVDNAVIIDEGYQLKYREQLRMERNVQYIDSLYWSCKSKDDKLKALSQHIPKEFEAGIVDTTINGIKIKSTKLPFNTNKY